MARARSGFRGHRGGGHRLTEWSSLLDAGFTSVAATGATLISSVGFEDPGTIIRSRGSITVLPATFAADSNPVGAFGVGLVTAEALAIGITALPHPYRDADWGGWMVWQPFAFKWEFGDATGFSRGDWTYDIDSKAMRKVSPSTAMVFVAESQSGAFDIHESVRLLLKLP